MKTLPQKFLGGGSALLLLIGLTSSAIAGPGPQFWQQQDKLRAENAAKAKAAAQAAKPADAPAMACPNCKTSKVEEFSGTNGPGRIAPHYTVVGTKHECASCGGAVTTVRGRTTNDMKDNCPICAKAKAANAACCPATT